MSEEKIKIKPMTIDEMLLSADRLTRFKFPEMKYNRVFKDIISKHLITPKISFKEYETLPPERISELIEEIFEQSIGEKTFNYALNSIIFEFDNNVFVINEETKKLMQTKIPYTSILEKSENKELCQNLYLLKQVLSENQTPKDIRKLYGTKFPIEKVVLAEGITEEILLPKFGQIMGFDFNENGVEVIPAGGKNQVAKDYLVLRERLKLPIIILLDADAKKIADTISEKLRKQDKLILIEKGEFEDILPLKLLKKAINDKFQNIFSISTADFSDKIGRVKDLEEIYRINGLGEFKKAEFANSINNLLKSTDKNFVSDEIKAIIEEIRT